MLLSAEVTVKFSSESYSVSEGDGYVNVTLLLNGEAAREIIVSVEDVDGSATGMYCTVTVIIICQILIIHCLHSYFKFFLFSTVQQWMTIFQSQKKWYFHWGLRKWFCL